MWTLAGPGPKRGVPRKSCLGPALILLATLTGGGCSGNTPPPPAAGHIANVSGWVDSLFSPVLYRLGEPPLHSSLSAQTIRLTYVPPFDPPFALAVTSVADSALLSAAFLDPRGKPRAQCRAPLPRSRWVQLQQMINELRFWEVTPKPREVILDQRFLLFEGVDSAGYHAVFAEPRESRVLILEGWLHYLAREAALPCYLSAGA